ncbi:MAG: PAS domain S-box protein [Desulfotignum sp.]
MIGNHTHTPSENQKQAFETEEALRKSEEQFRSIFQNHAAVKLLIDPDTGDIVQANTAAGKFYGWPPEDLTKKRIQDINTLAPEQIHAHMDKARSLHRTYFEFRHRLADGSVRDVEVYSSKVEVGGKELLHSIVHDVTSRRQAEEQLKKSHDLLSRLARLVPGVIYQYRLYPDGRSAFPYASPGMKDIYEVTPEQVKEDATPVYGRLHPDDYDHVLDTIQKSADTLETFYCEFRVVLPRQGLRWRWSQAHPERMPDGSTLWHGIISDITKRKQAEERLQQAQKMEAIGTLAGGIAHDFNNILFPIIGHADMLLDDIPKDSPFRKSLEQIHTGAIRARELVRQILAFSRQEKNELARMKIQPIVKEVLKLIRSTIPTTIAINQRLHAGCGPVKADPVQIHQIVMNLATNAYHAMAEKGGTLTVTLKEIQVNPSDPVSSDFHPGPYARLSVTDTGTGMDKETAEKIFDPFFTTKKKGKGTGMGLSVVHGIVKDMNGTMEVQTEPGKGTAFHVFLPVTGNGAAENEPLIKEPLVGGSERILLVDDEKPVIAIEKQLLSRLGYRVTGCIDSTEALEMFAADPDRFDMVITDIAMPKMSGDKLAGELLKIRPDIPILLCTGFSEIMTHKKMASIGVKGLIMKPFVINDLDRKLREIFG